MNLRLLNLASRKKNKHGSIVRFKTRFDILNQAWISSVTDRHRDGRTNGCKKQRALIQLDCVNNDVKVTATRPNRCCCFFLKSDLGLLGLQVMCCQLSATVYGLLVEFVCIFLCLLRVLIVSTSKIYRMDRFVSEMICYYIYYRVEYLLTQAYCSFT